MDDFIPTRTWAPQLDEWKSPPYKNRNELSRDSSYRYATTSPILMHQTSQQINPPESSPHQQGSSYFQYTSNINNAPSPSSNTSLSYTPSRIDNDIEEVLFIFVFFNKIEFLFIITIPSLFCYCLFLVLIR